MSGLRLVSKSLPKIAGKVFNRKYIMLGRLVTQWDDIVGPDLAKRTQPVKIRYYKAKNQKDKPKASLDIACSTAEATLLHYQKDLILERINRIFGDSWISAIRFVPMAANTQPVIPKKRKKALTLNEKTALSNLVQTVEDPEIQEKLKNLGSAILQDKDS